MDTSSNTHAYKQDKLTFISPIAISEGNKHVLEVLNDENVNRMYGWTICKLKRQYKRLIDQDLSSMIYESKRLMLDDTSATVLDIVDNTDHIRLYYPTDDALRNKGSLILVPPKYIAHLS